MRQARNLFYSINYFSIRNETMENCLISVGSSRYYEVIKPSEKQFANHHLLHTVKQVNGQIAFKQAYERSLTLKFLQRSTIPDNYVTDHFCYILHGEVYVYKIAISKLQIEKYTQEMRQPQKTSKGVFITCHKSHQIFGLQQYPLNIYQKLVFEATENTKIVVFPIDLSLTSFRKIFNMNLVQYRAEILKRFYFFKQLEIQKLKKIALHSKRLHAQKGQLLIKQGNSFPFLPLIISGEIMSVYKNEAQRIFGKDEVIGLEEVLDDQQYQFDFQLICLTDCQIMFISKTHIIKVYKIKYRLEQKQSIHIKSRRITEYEQEKQRLNEINSPPKKKETNSPKLKTFVFQSQTKDSKKSQENRPVTSTCRKNTKVKQVNYSTFYNNKNPNSSKNHFKTEGSQPTNSNHYFPLKTEQSFAHTTALNENNISLGELCLRKFINRKQRRQNCEIMKYLRSNAPQLKLNPFKQYALVKPLHVSNSNYIKNLKRKLKKSYLKTGGSKQREQKQKQARFSFFFKEDGHD